MYSRISIFSRPFRITVRFPLGISRILMMRAAVPTLYMSSGAGSSTSLSRCNTAPRMPPSAFTARTRLMLLSRPTVIGVIAPGKSTELRSVRIGMISGTSTSSATSSPPVTIGITWCLPSSSSGSRLASSTSMVSIILSFLLIVYRYKYIMVQR